MILEKIYGFKNVREVKDEETYFDFTQDKIYTAVFVNNGKGATVTIEKVIGEELFLEECYGITF